MGLFFLLFFISAQTSPLTLADLDEWLFEQEEEVNKCYSDIALAPDTPPDAESEAYNQLRRFVEDIS